MNDDSARQSVDLLTYLLDVANNQLTELQQLRTALAVNGPASSVELSVDSKALVKPIVKVYDIDPDVACARAQELFDDLIIKYGPKIPS